MKVTGAFDARENRADVYAFLADPRRVSTALPGEVQVDASDAAVVVHVRVGIGPLAGTMEVHMRVADRTPETDVIYSGNASGLGSSVQMSATFELASWPDGATHVTWTGEATFSGALGPIAGPALDSIAQRSMSDFVGGMQRALARAHASRSPD